MSAPRTPAHTHTRTRGTAPQRPERRAGGRGERPQRKRPNGRERERERYNVRKKERTPWLKKAGPMHLLCRGGETPPEVPPPVPRKTARSGGQHPRSFPWRLPESPRKRSSGQPPPECYMTHFASPRPAQDGAVGGSTPAAVPEAPPRVTAHAVFGSAPIRLLLYDSIQTASPPCPPSLNPRGGGTSCSGGPAPSESASALAPACQGAGASLERRRRWPGGATARR